MKRILFVCLGNICRSAMAKYIFQDLVTRNGLDRNFVIDSAGTSNEEEGNPIYPPAREILAQHGISSKGHSARQVRHSDYLDFDYIISSDSRNAQRLQRIFGGDPNGKISCLLDHTPESDHQHHFRDIADPWYTRNFEQAYEDILIGCTALLEELQ